MAETSIEWTATRLPDGSSVPGYTFNPWWGCVKISPACTHCYAATWANRYGVAWGPKAERRFFGEHHWHEPVVWNKKAAKDGIRRKVFCASMADIFEELPADHPQVEQMDTERQRAFQLMLETPHLDWLLLTKRPENILNLVPHGPRDWRKDWPQNVWAGTTVENQEYADKRIPHLLKVPTPVRFLSMEPLLGPVDLTHIPGEIDGQAFEFDALDGKWHAKGGFDPGYVSERLRWIVTGGESGPGARPSHPDWFRSIRDQCAAAGVAYFHKQNGAWSPFYDRDHDDPDWRNVPQEKPGLCRLNIVGGQGFHGDRVVYFENLGKKAAGALLDGKLHREFPEASR